TSCWRRRQLVWTSSVRVFAWSVRVIWSPWNEYARSLQHKHPRPDVVAAWRRFIRCSIPDQSADPSALDTLTLTLGSGYTDQFGRSGDINYRFTMGIEQQAWKITGVCEIYSEGCFDITWG